MLTTTSENMFTASDDDDFAHFQYLPWVRLDTQERSAQSEAPGLRLFVKCKFDGDGYDLLISDFKRVWREQATGERFMEKHAACAKNFSETPVSAILPILKKYLRRQEDDVQYLSSFVNDDMDNLSLETCGTIGTVPFRWTFECAQIPPRLASGKITAGGILYANLTLPLCVIVHEQERRLRELEALLERKTRELSDCHELLSGSASFMPARSEPFNKHEFNVASDEQFRTKGVVSEALPERCFANPPLNHMYTLCLEKLRHSTSSGMADHADETAEDPVLQPEYPPTVPADVLASQYFASGTVDLTAASTASEQPRASKKEYEESLEILRRKERNERLAQVKSQSEAKKKRRKII